MFYLFVYYHICLCKFSKAKLTYLWRQPKLMQWLMKHENVKLFKPYVNVMPLYYW